HSTRLQSTGSWIPVGLLLGGMVALVSVAVTPPVLAAAGGDPSGARRPAPGATGPKQVVFPRDIRPILADKCFQCHGPDAKQRKGKLRLDNRRDVTAPAASGSPAIVPGNLEDSELYRRITSDDPEERMPPLESR